MLALWGARSGASVTDTGARQGSGVPTNADNSAHLTDVAVSDGAAERSAHVVVVEDDALFATGIEALLTTAGYLVSVVPSAEDPSLPAALHTADLVVLDLVLPGASGFDVLSRLRATIGDMSNPDVPVLVLSAHNPMSYRLRSLSVGADDFVSKPPNPQELLLRIRALLRRSTHASAGLQRLTGIRPGGGDLLIDPREVAYVHAAGNYSYACGRGFRHLIGENIGQVEDRLAGQFIRTHRSYLVNPAFVSGARWEGRSEYLLEIDAEAGDTVPVSRARREAVRGTLGL